MLDFGADGRTLEPLVDTGTTPEEHRQFEARIYRRYKYDLTHYLRFFREMQQRLNLPVKLSFNVARHTWASLARDRGVPVSVISVGLGHISEKTTQIYLDELDNRKVDEANEMVADLLNDPKETKTKARKGNGRNENGGR